MKSHRWLPCVLLPVILLAACQSDRPGGVPRSDSPFASPVKSGSCALSFWPLAQVRPGHGVGRFRADLTLHLEYHQLRIER